MTNAGARATTAAATLLVFFLLWAGIAARPWTKSRPAAADPRAVALAERERSLKKHAATVNRIVDRRWSAYRAALARRQGAIAVAELRHLRALESAYASALAAAQTADARAASARAYAARVVAWAEAVTANGGSSQAASVALPSPAAPATRRAKAASAAAQPQAASGGPSPVVAPPPAPSAPAAAAA
ncbi:MAG: hypothetical protein ACXVZP_12695, partial [Gaiellaceae bacterium]